MALGRGSMIVYGTGLQLPGCHGTRMYGLWHDLDVSQQLSGFVKGYSLPQLL